MVTRTAEMSSSLAGTELSDRRIVDVPVLETDECAFAVEISSSEVMAAWSVGRSRVDDTGRWPVVVTCWGDERGSWEDRVRKEDLFSRFYFEEAPSAADCSPRAIIERASRVDAQAFLDARLEDDPWGIDDGQEASGEGDASHLDWFEPEGQPTALLFLPTPNSWETLAYLHWYAAAGFDTEPFVALLRGWFERYGAELVAHFGTMLDFVVRRPPADYEAALELGTQQVIVAPCTTMPLGVALAHHAKALVGLERWFLQERP